MALRDSSILQVQPLTGLLKPLFLYTLKNYVADQRMDVGSIYQDLFICHFQVQSGAV